MGISKSRMKAYYDTYMKVEGRTLDDAYGRCSSAKKCAWESIRERMVKQGGFGLSVLHANSFNFTTGYMYKDEQGLKHFVVDTMCNIEDVLVSEL